MNSNALYILFVFCLVFAVSITFVGMRYADTIQHESAHKQNFKYVGVDSNIEIYSYGLGGGKTIPLEVPKRDMTNLELSNSITEAIGYQLLPPLEILVTLQVLLIFLLVANMKGSV
jgi:hypothetical protein